TNQLTKPQIAEYITEDNWTTFLKRHMDVTDMQKTFREQPHNVFIFTDFIRMAFKFFVQEKLLDKDVIDAVKNLNYIVVDMEIFSANEKGSMQQLDISSSNESQFNNDDFDFTASYELNSASNMLSRSDHLINDDFDSTASHALNSVSDILNSSDQLISADFECSFSTTSDASNMKEIELQTEARTEYIQTLVDGKINFQPL
ncbi:8239_t:CDS:2, partial [Racocetra fulgida]